MCCVLLAPWLLLIGREIVSRPSVPKLLPKTISSKYPPTTRVFKCKPGPWGDLECTKIRIEPPDEFISTSDYAPNPLRWVLKNFSKKQLDELLESAHLDASQRKTLLAKAKKDPSINGWVIAPDEGLVWKLKPDQRSIIYSTLSVFPENPSQYEPFRFRAETADEWFEESDLLPETISLVKNLLYQRGTSLLFSDFDLVLPLLASNAEKKKLLKTLSRKSTLLIKLMVNKDSDLPALVRYWGKGGRSKDLEPLLRSLSNVPGGQEIDLNHLLTAFARMRMYTYPVPSDDPTASRHDCYWTCMNFFSRHVDDRFADVKYVKQILESDYYPIPSNPLFGDLMFLTKPNGEAVHAAVYIADDILFTKNGASYSSPWILMSLKDIIAFYPSNLPLQVRVYRSKMF